MSQIHKTAIIGKNCKIGSNVTVGPFTVIEDNVKIGMAIMDRNYDEFKKYVSEDMKLISGDSNLQDFYEFSEESFSRNSSVSWESFNLRDIDVSFSPDMSMAILTFYAEGTYTNGDSENMIEYSTRASSVWIATDSGWKTVHTNWAPYGGGSGIPKI